MCLGTIELRAQTPPMPPLLAKDNILTITNDWRGVLKTGNRWKTNHLTVDLVDQEPIPQEPPMPAPPTITTTVTTITTPAANPVMVQPQPRVDPIWKRPTTFTANCHCGTTNSGVRPILIVTNGWTATNGGSIGHRTITLPCRNCGDAFDAQNTIFVPFSIAVEDPAPVPMGGGGASSVLPDTNAPMATITNLLPASILAFTNQVPVSFRINNGHFYWLDGLTGQQVTKALDLEFQAHSNYFYTVWLCSPLSTHGSNWIEYPSDKQLHPARGDFMAGLSVPLYDTNRFYCVRAFNGGNRAIWQ